MFVAALHQAGLRLLAERSVALLREPMIAVAPYESLDTIARSSRESIVLVHDFSPDVERSVRWLRETTATLPSVAAFALLASPASRALSAILRAPRLAVAGVAIGTEERAATLASRLSAARGSSELRALPALVAATWKLDGSLPDILDAFAQDPRGHPTVHSLLRDTGVSRKTFVREVEQAGFNPPLRFLQVVRVLGATMVLQRGHTTAQTAEHIGYSSGETMRQHFLALFGAPPRVARAAGAASVAEQIRERVLIAGR